MSDRPKGALSLRWTGPALDSGAMPARELATALIGFADALASTSRFLEPDAEPPSADIQALQDGSFTVHIIVQDPSLVERAMDLLTGRETGAAVNAVTIVAALTAAIRFSVKRVGRAVRSRRQISPQVTRIEFDDGTAIEVPHAAVDLADDLSFNSGMARAVAPVDRDGVTGLEVTPRGADTVRVDKPHAGAFALGGPAGEGVSSVNTYETVVTPVRIAFADRSRWHVTDGGGPFWVDLADKEFTDRVRSGDVAFRAGDRFRVHMRVTQYERQDGRLRAEHVIEKVLDHRPAGRQLTIGD